MAWYGGAEATKKQPGFDRARMYEVGAVLKGVVEINTFMRDCRIPKLPILQGTHQEGRGTKFANCMSDVLYS